MMNAASVKQMSTGALRRWVARRVDYDVTTTDREQLTVIAMSVSGNVRPSRNLPGVIDWSLQMARTVAAGPFAFREGTAKLHKDARTAERAVEAAEARKAKGIAKIGSKGGSLTDDEVRWIRQQRQDNPRITCQALSDAVQNRVNANMIYAIIKGQAYKHVV